MTIHARRCIDEIETLRELLEAGSDLSGRAVQAIRIPSGLIDWPQVAPSLRGSAFLGCRFEATADEDVVRASGAIVIDEISGLPYDPFRTALYTAAELNSPAAFGDITADEAIYNHFVAAGRHAPGIIEALTQRLHDLSIEDALHDRVHELGHPPIVAIMGGHSTRRDAPEFTIAARVAFELTRADFTVASGGGPGSMEAANLGAHLAPTDDPSAIDESVAVLSRAPHYTDAGHDAAAVEIADRFPGGPATLAIPTWFYGHEPSNRFSTDIAKMFANSIREDSLVSIAEAGIVFTPGSAGTAQEVFQDAAQNHYETLGPAAPMVFIGVDHWTTGTGIFDVVRRQAGDKDYAELLLVTDDPSEAVAFLKEATTSTQ